MVDNRKNSFEFYGYDFMVDQDLKVWLIEVNSSPSMECKGQPILQDLVKSVLTDLAKVVVDWQAKKTSDTGDFILVSKQKNEAVSYSKQVNIGKPLDLSVHGKKYGFKMVL